jgi:hypothetical protein
MTSPAELGFKGFSEVFWEVKKVAPEVGLEPTTNRLTADRSTTELLRNQKNEGEIETFRLRVFKRNFNF